jgi:hypothetical protein
MPKSRTQSLSPREKMLRDLVVPLTAAQIEELEGVVQEALDVVRRDADSWGDLEINAWLRLNALRDFRAGKLAKNDQLWRDYFPHPNLNRSENLRRRDWTELNGKREKDGYVGPENVTEGWYGAANFCYQRHMQYGEAFLWRMLEVLSEEKRDGQRAKLRLPETIRQQDGKVIRVDLQRFKIAASAGRALDKYRRGRVEAYERSLAAAKLLEQEGQGSSVLKKTRDNRVPLTAFVEPELRRAFNALARSGGLTTQELLYEVTQYLVQSAQNDPSLVRDLAEHAARRRQLKQQILSSAAKRLLKSPGPA